MRHFGHDVFDIIFRVGAEDVHQALSPLLALGAQPIAAVGLLAVTDEVDYGLGRSQRDVEEKSKRMHCGRVSCRGNLVRERA